MRKVRMTVVLTMTVVAGSLILSAAGPANASTSQSDVSLSLPDFHAMIVAPQQTSPRPPKTSTIPLPPGEGMELTKKMCSGCHGTDTWAAQRHTKEQWNGIIDNMVSKGMEASDEDLDKIATYLGTNLGPDSSPATAPGSVATKMTSSPSSATATPPGR